MKQKAILRRTLVLGYVLFFALFAIFGAIVYGVARLSTPQSSQPLDSDPKVAEAVTKAAEAAVPVIRANGFQCERVIDADLETLDHYGLPIRIMCSGGMSYRIWFDPQEPDATKRSLGMRVRPM
jgi:hypothetical protein